MKSVRPILAALLYASILMLIVRADDDRDAAKRKARMEKKGAVVQFDKREWTSAIDYSTRHYKVTSNTSRDVCEYIGDMMELAYNTYSDIFDFNGSMDQLPINAYATMEEFRPVADAHGFQFRDVSGFYTSADGGAIFLPYVISAGEHPLTVLLHEGAHQFVHEAIDMPVPWKYTEYFDEKSRRLNSTPIWLNEGLACYLETAQYDGNALELGRVNKLRLLHLQAMIRNSTAPSVAETVSRKNGQPFAVEHYAVAWGLVWYLRHDSDVAARDLRRAALNRYIESVKLGFFEDPDIDFRNVFLKDDEPRKDFLVAWREYVGRRSLEVFLSEIVGNGDIAAWEKDWQAWIMRRNARYAFGGTKRGDAIFNEGDLRLGGK